MKYNRKKHGAGRDRFKGSSDPRKLGRGFFVAFLKGCGNEGERLGFGVGDS
jgi:hypothetical protein